MVDLVIFGDGVAAELANYYFETDSNYTVVAFCVDDQYVRGRDSLWGKPLFGSSEVPERFSPMSTQIFIALGYSAINSSRKIKFRWAKNKGFNLASYVSSKAVLAGNVIIGENAFVLEQNNIQPFTEIGDNVTLWSGNHIGHHSHIGNHVFIASHAVISGNVSISDEVFIGVNATVRDNVRIGERSVIGAGATVMSNVPSGKVVGGPRSRVSGSSEHLKDI